MKRTYELIYVLKPDAPESEVADLHKQVAEIVERMGGTIDKAVLINAGLKELMGFHLQRIVKAGSPALLFKSASLLGEDEQIDIERGRRMVELGLARWADPEQTSIRMTLRGAVKHLQHDYFNQMKELRGQSERSGIRRAGS